MPSFTPPRQNRTWLARLDRFAQTIRRTCNRNRIAMESGRPHQRPRTRASAPAHRHPSPSPAHGSTSTARGYVFQDFVPLWARLLPDSVHEPRPDEKASNGAACNDVSLAEQRTEYEAGIAKLRELQQSLPACTEGYTRLASTKR